MGVSWPLSLCTRDVTTVDCVTFIGLTKKNRLRLDGLWRGGRTLLVSVAHGWATSFRAFYSAAVVRRRQFKGHVPYWSLVPVEISRVWSASFVDWPLYLSIWRVLFGVQVESIARDRCDFVRPHLSSMSCNYRPFDNITTRLRFLDYWPTFDGRRKLISVRLDGWIMATGQEAIPAKTSLAWPVTSTTFDLQPLVVMMMTVITG